MGTYRGRSLVDFTSPAAGFDQPLALWSACHDRVRRMTNLLTRLSAHVRTAGVDGEARAGASSVRRYFDEAAPHHHGDEEHDLFPLLRERAVRLDAARREELLGAIDRLERDHREIGALWDVLRVPLKRIEAGDAADLNAAQVAQFFDRYQQHMQIEDTIIEAALHELLTGDDLARIGRSMAQRRGVDRGELTA